ncbi:hypothetical protein [Aquimarina longa]|uniref:hypothetical protein n=1 Tax=Aquimarina longa TaxID=1080221 RepID=UPI0011DF2ADC|nr:hypothetical protein [Aquimarina longa]
MISSSMVTAFETFLKRTIGKEVLIVNTNMGIEVYYYSKNDYSIFIREGVLLYTLARIDHEKLKFVNNLNREEVCRNFCETLIAFSQYPQIFLAYAKKFIYLKEKNKSSRYVIPILDSFFEETLKTLNETGEVPHYKKIEKTKKRFQKLGSEKNIIMNLIAEILLKIHSN